MIENKIIIIPIEGNFDHSADFLRQTAITLSKKNDVYIYDQINSNFFLNKNESVEYPKYKNIYFHQVKYFLPFRRFAFIEKLNRQLSFKLFLRKFRKKNKIVWIFYPNYFDLAKIKDKNTVSVYDCVDYNDDHIKEELLINNSDYFFVNSLTLKKNHSNKSKKPIYISSQGFFKPDERMIEENNLIYTKPIIGFVGGINYRLDFKLINELIKRNQQWQFIFYGPRQIDKQKDQKFNTEKWLNKIKKFKNVTFGQSSNRYEVYSVIKKFKLAIIPYNSSIIFNKHCYPMKIFEYFYFGKKIISTEIEELKLNKFKEFIKISDKVEDWEINIKNLLKEKAQADQLKKQRKIAIANSWSKKIEKISKTIFFN